MLDICKYCYHNEVCDLWGDAECQDAACYVGLGDACDLFRDIRKLQSATYEEIKDAKNYRDLMALFEQNKVSPKDILFAAKIKEIIPAARFREIMDAELDGRLTITPR